MKSLALNLSVIFAIAGFASTVFLCVKACSSRPMEMEPLSYRVAVGRDWGGAIDVGAVERSPDLLAGLVLLNSVIQGPKLNIAFLTPPRKYQIPSNARNSKTACTETR